MIVFALLCLAAVVQLALAWWQPIEGYDGNHQLGWLRMFPAELSRNGFPVHWISDAFNGLGAPSFYFYPPVAYWLGALIHLTFRESNPEQLFHAVGILGSLASVATCAWSLRALGLRALGASGIRRWSAALIYGFAPFRFFELYWRNGISEHIAFIFLPVALIGGFRLLVGAEPRWKMIFLLAMSTALVLLSSVPQGIVLMLALCVMAVVLWREWTWRRILAIKLALALAGVLTAFYTVPILLYRQFTRGDFLYRRLGATFWSSLIHWQDLRLTSNDLLSLATCVVVLIVAIGTSRGITNTGDGRMRLLLRVVSGIAAAIIFVHLPFVSQPFWDHFPPLKILQMPMRFGGLMVWCLAILYCAGPRASAPTNWLVGASAVIAIGWCLITAANVHVNPLGGYHDPYEPAEYATKFTYRDEWDVIHFAQSAKSLPMVRYDSANGDRISVIGDAPAMRVSLARPQEVTLRRFYWPAFKLFAGTTELPTRADGAGLTLVSLPKGDYTVVGALTTSASERVANWLSGCGLLAVVIGSVLLRRRKS